MLKKNYSKTGKSCRVTFNLPPETGGETALLCGDFTDWQKQAKAMKPLKKGGFSLTLCLPAEQSYRFRYLLDGIHWHNDDQADGYIPNDYGSQDSLIIL